MKRLPPFLLTVAVLATAFSFAAPAYGQSPQIMCAEHDVVIEQFLQRHGEHPRVRGLSSTGFILEILVNDETRSWSVFMTNPGGRTCLMSFGQDWEEFAPKPPGSDS